MDLLAEFREIRRSIPVRAGDLQEQMHKRRDAMQRVLRGVPLDEIRALSPDSLHNWEIDVVRNELEFRRDNPDFVPRQRRRVEAGPPPPSIWDRILGRDTV